MSEHKQLQPPDYHRCIEQVLSSPTACLTLLDRLAAMNEQSARILWHAPFDVDALNAKVKGYRPIGGPDVHARVPAEVQLVALQETFRSYVQTDQDLWKRLYDFMVVPPMEKSTIELIWDIRSTIEQLRRRVVEYELSHEQPARDSHRQ